MINSQRETLEKNTDEIRLLKEKITNTNQNIKHRAEINQGDGYPKEIVLFFIAIISLKIFKEPLKH